MTPRWLANTVVKLSRVSVTQALAAVWTRQYGV